MTLLDDPRALREAYLLPYRGDTQKMYSVWLNRYSRWCASRGLDLLAVRREDVERYVADLIDRGLKPSSILIAMRPVRGIYRYAYYEELIDRDPAVRVRLPKVSEGLSKVIGLDRDQLRAFLAAGEDLGGRYHGTAFLLGCMALRAGEAASLHVDSYAGTVRGHRVLEFVGKGGVPARMPVPVPVLAALDAAAGGRTTGPLLLRRGGLPMTRRHVYIVVGTIARRAGIAHRVTSHSIRHSAITNALECGQPPSKVQVLARHSLLKTTMRYDCRRTNLDAHAVHSLVSFIAPTRDEE